MCRHHMWVDFTFRFELFLCESHASGVTGGLPASVTCIVLICGFLCSVWFRGTNSLLHRFPHTSNNLYLNRNFQIVIHEDSVITLTRLYFLRFYYILTFRTDMDMYKKSVLVSIKLIDLLPLNSIRIQSCSQPKKTAVSTSPTVEGAMSWRSTTCTMR